MGKISPVAAKYIVRAELEANGVVEKPDAVGAIFGQTEGLLGAELELRELQKSGRIGRIEVNVDSKAGRTLGHIEVPSSMDKAETAIIAAALETIDRIGPCTAKIKVIAIDDVRISKRKFIIDRAKDLLMHLMREMLPDTQEITDAVRDSVRTAEVVEWGPDKLAAGPDIMSEDEIIVVEGRADVLNLLKHGIKNVIAVEGTHIPKSLADMSKQKTVTLFVDGDRGGDLIFKEMKQVSEVDFIARAPNGLEVEELTKKELHKCLRAKIATEQVSGSIEEVPTANLDDDDDEDDDEEERGTAIRKEPQMPLVSPMRQPTTTMGSNQPLSPQQTRAVQGAVKEYLKLPSSSTMPQRPPTMMPTREQPISQAMMPATRAPTEVIHLDDRRKETFRKLIEEIIGTRGAYLLDDKLDILGKVPLTELPRSLEGMGNVQAIVIDGVITTRLLDMTYKSRSIKYIVGMRRIGIPRPPVDVLLLTPQELGV